MPAFCKKCGSKARVHYAAGFDIYTCKICCFSVDERTAEEHFDFKDVV